MITPGGFINPTSYLETEETSHEVEKYTNFLTGVTSDNPGFRPTIINSVTATFKAEEIWRNNIEAGKRVIWRYLGTTDGVVRIFPGIQLPKNYDISRRPWYERSIAYKGKMVLSTPYNDLWGSGYLITLSTAITEPGSSKRTMAIAGTDFTMSYLYNTLITIPEYEKVCNNGQYECFLIDDSGFIVLHRDFVQPSTKQPHLENVHLTYKEPAIADDLVSNNVMVKSKCIDFENIKEQYSYRVTTSASQYDRLSSYAKYEIRPVENTNIFIIIKRKLYIPGQTICCKTYGQSPSVLACKTSKCDCLCYTTTNFNYCLNEYELLADAAPTCAPRTPALETKSISEVEKIKDIQRCFLTECDKQTSMSGCHGISGCSWCSKGQDVKPLASPYCTRQENCYFGIEGLSQCSSGICEESTKPTEGKAGGFPVFVIGGVVAPVFFMVIFAIFIYKKRHTPHRSRADRNAAGNTNIASSNSFARENHAFDSFQQNQNNGGINSVYYDNREAYVQPSAPMHNVTSQHIAPPTYDESQRSHAPYIFYQGRYK